MTPACAAPALSRIEAPRTAMNVFMTSPFCRFDAWAPGKVKAPRPETCDEPLNPVPLGRQGPRPCLLELAAEAQEQVFAEARTDELDRRRQAGVGHAGGQRQRGMAAEVERVCKWKRVVDADRPAGNLGGVQDADRKCFE